MPSAKEVVDKFANQIVEKRLADVKHKRELLLDFRASILDPVLDSGRDPKTAAGMARQYSEKRAELNQEGLKLEPFPGEILAVLDKFGVGNLEVSIFAPEIIIPPAAAHKELPSPTSLLAEPTPDERLEAWLQANPRESHWSLDILRAAGVSLTDRRMLRLLKEALVSIGVDTSPNKIMIADDETFRRGYAALIDMIAEYRDGTRTVDISKPMRPKTGTVFDSAAVTTFVASPPLSDALPLDRDGELPVGQALLPPPVLVDNEQEIEFAVGEEKMFLLACMLRDPRADEVRRKILQRQGQFSVREIERLNNIVTGLEAGVVIEDSESLVLEIAEDLKTYQAYKRAVVEKIQSNEKLQFLLSFFPTENGIALDNVVLEMAAAMQSRTVSPAPARKNTLDSSEQREIHSQLLVLTRGEVAAFGRLLGVPENWNELVRALRAHGITPEDGQYQKIKFRVDALIREERKDGKEVDQFLSSFRNKVFRFAKASIEERERIIDMQSSDEGKFFFSLLLSFSEQDIRHYATIFHNAYVTRGREI